MGSRRSLARPLCLGAPDAEHEREYRQASNDGRRYLLKAAAQARRGDCGQAIQSLATGANRIGSALTHGTGIRPWPEVHKGLLTAQRSAVEIVARSCKLPSSTLSGTRSAWRGTQLPAFTISEASRRVGVYARDAKKLPPRERRQQYGFAFDNLIAHAEEQRQDDLDDSRASWATAAQKRKAKERADEWAAIIRRAREAAAGIRR